VKEKVLSDRIFREVEDMVAAIEDTQEKINALCRLGEAYAWADDLDKARDSLTQAEEVASSIGLSAIRSAMFAHIALTYAKSELMEQAKQIIAERLNSVRQDGLKALALIHASAGETTKAISTSLEIGSAGGQAQALRYVAEYLASHGKTRDALQAAEALMSTRDTGFNPIEIPRITKAIMEAGDLRSFKKLLLPNAHRFGSAYRMVGLISRLYPEEASQVGRLFIEDLDSHAVTLRDPNSRHLSV
jgi:tetratricopeptide (TPR) repeat protein